MKQLLLIVCAGLAAFICYRQFARVNHAKHLSAPLANRLTFEYKGTVKGLFDLVTAGSGVKYDVNAAVGTLPFHGSFKNSPIVQIQSAVADQAHVKYRPPAPGRDGIQVLPAR